MFLLWGRGMQTNTESYVQNDLVSIIVPVYNVEEYVGVCIKSLVLQTYKNIEIFLVDDGSTEGSGEVCKEWATRDSRIVYIQKTNGGAASARNAALDRCRGKYITFVDSDDYIDDNYIEVLHAAIVDTEADISICGWKNETKSEFVKADIARGNVVYTKIEALNKLLYQEDFDTAMWAKLYKAQLFERIRFPEGNIYEDIAIIYKVFELVGRVTYVNYVGYHYLLRETSTTLKKFSLKKMDLIDVVEEMEVYILENCPEVKDAMRSKFVRANFHIYLQIPRDEEFAAERVRIEKNIDKCRKSVLGDKRTRRGTKIALLISGINYSVFYKLKNLKQMGKC